MITGISKLTVDHDFVAAAVQDHLRRHFRDGYCPTLIDVQLDTAGQRADRRFMLTLGPPTKAEPAPTLSSSSRQLDLET